MIKCPRCELNYIADDEKLCKVCIREIKGGQKQDDFEPCSICNAAPALPGKDICLGCYKEMHSHQTSERKHVSVDEEIELSSASTMDEIIPNVKEDIDQEEFDDDDSDLSLESIIEDESDEDDDDDDF